MSQDWVQRAIAAKRRHEAELLRKPNVVAVGVGRRAQGGAFTDDVCIVVSVKRKVPAALLSREDLIPATLDGVPVDVIETGEIVAH